MPFDHDKLRDLFVEACDLPTSQQAAFVEENCNDEELKKELLELLQSDGKSGILADDQMASGINFAVDLTGQVIDKYKLLQQIGEGGFGLVYMAEQIEPVQRKVALKIIKPGMDTRHALARFEAERQALALMEHPNICRVLDAGATNLGHPYFVMELVKGVPINTYCRSEQVSVKERLQLLQSVCHAVQHAHSKGIIHRDLKPSNVMITFHDTIPVPKIIDFGIAKALNQRMTEKTLFTRYGQMLGTPMYMSPEQAEMSGLDIDIRSDVYSLGVLMYELLTDTPPFSSEKLQTATYADMIRIIREEEPPTPSRRLTSLSKSGRLSQNGSPAKTIGVNPKIHNDLDRIVMKAIEKDRRRRYETVSELGKDIDRYLNDEPVQAGSPSLGYRMQKFVARNRLLVTSVASILSALLLGLVISTVGFINADSANRRAESALTDEQKQRTRAEREELRAKKALHSEREQRERVESSLYFQQISKAQRELASAQHVLKQCPERFRGWEWHYLNRIAKPNVLTLKGMSLPGVTSMEYSPDGRLLAAGCYEWLNPRRPGNLIVWDTASGGEIFRIDDFQGGFANLDFSPDGEQIAAVSGNGFGVRIWNVATGEKVHSVAKGSFYNIQYHPAGDSFVTGGSDTILHWFDSKNGQPTRTFTGHRARIFGLSFSPDGKMLASTAHDGELIVWDTDTGKIIRRFPDSGNRHACFSPDGKLLVTSGYRTDHGNGGIFVYSVGHSIKPVASHRNVFEHVTRANFSPDGEYIVLSRHGGSLRIWEPITGREVFQKPAHMLTVGISCFSPDGWRFATAGSDKLVKSWDFSSLQQPVLRVPDRSFLQGIAFHPNGNVATGGGYHRSAPRLGQKVVSEFAFDQRHSPMLVRQFVGAQQWIASLDFSDDGKTLAATGSEGNINIWNVSPCNSDTVFPRTVRLVKQIPAHSKPANSIAFDRSGNHVYSGGEDGKLMVTDIVNNELGQEITKLKKAINCVAVHPTYAIVATASDNQLVQLWNTDSGKQIQELNDHAAKVTNVAFSTDGNLLASTDDNGIAMVWQVHKETGKFHVTRLAKLKCHNRKITGVSFSPDQDRLATISLDGTAALWELVTFQEAIRLKPQGENSNFFQIEFSPDGTKLLGAQAEQITIWNAGSIESGDGRNQPNEQNLIRWHEETAESCRNSKNWYGMFFHADRMVSLQPEDGNHYFVRGIAHANQNRTQAAIDDFETAEENGCVAPLMFAYRASIHLRQHNLEKFEKDVRELVLLAQGDNNPAFLQVAVLGLPLLAESLQSEIFELLDKKTNKDPLFLCRSEEFKLAEVATDSSMDQQTATMASVSNGLIHSLCQLRLGQMKASQISFEKSVWKWEQILASDLRSMQPTAVEQVIVEQLISEATSLFEKNEVEQLGDWCWFNASPAQRRQVGAMLGELDLSISDTKFEQVIHSLQDLVSSSPETVPRPTSAASQ